MGGRRWADVLKDSRKAKKILESYGFECWSPALKEVSEETDERGLISTGPKGLAVYWEQDKDALKKADALVSIRGDLASEGVGYEIGMAKWKYKIPVVVISEYSVGRITHLEATAVVRSYRAAAKLLRGLL